MFYQNEMNGSDSSIILLFPVSTYHAYNMYGGKSFYRNGLDKTDVQSVGVKRPITSLAWDFNNLNQHNILIENNVYHWFKDKFDSPVIVYPDYYLEKHPDYFERAKVIVLVHHCEYFSSKMYQTLKENAKRSKILNLGGNQVYWKIQWDKNYITLQVRKDGQFFDHPLETGGRWRDEFYNESSLLGVAYVNEAYDTFEPYLNSDSIVFGEKGILGRSLCGHEMDRRFYNSLESNDIISKVIQLNHLGGEVVISQNGKVLSFGSTEIGAGLGVDSTLDQMIVKWLEGKL